MIAICALKTISAVMVNAVAFSCEARQDCNGKGYELKRGYCVIESRCYSSSDVNSSNPCMVGAQEQFCLILLIASTLI